MVEGWGCVWGGGGVSSREVEELRKMGKGLTSNSTTQAGTREHLVQDITEHRTYI